MISIKQLPTVFLLLTGLDPDLLEESRDSRPSVGFADMTRNMEKVV
jgi:hypothetical protein